MRAHDSAKTAAHTPAKGCRCECGVSICVAASSLAGRSDQSKLSAPVGGGRISIRARIKCAVVLVAG
eukprot:2829096-Pyramimonas_sp.AAC.1